MNDGATYQPHHFNIQVYTMRLSSHHWDIWVSVVCRWAQAGRPRLQSNIDLAMKISTVPNNVIPEIHSVNLKDRTQANMYNIQSADYVLPTMHW